MKISFKRLISFLLCVSMLIICLASCEQEAPKPNVYVDEDGYVVVNGERTDIMAASEDTDGDDANAPSNPDNNTDSSNKPDVNLDQSAVDNAALSAAVNSAYELYKQEHPEYNGSLTDWKNDIKSGALKSEKKYELITTGGKYNATVSSGTAVVESGDLKLTNAVMALNEKVILPLGYGSSWKMSFRGILMPDGAGGGQIITNDPSSTDARFYLGVNGTNNVMYLGVSIAGIYANYCWSVPLATMKANHSYVISYENGEYVLTIDNGSPIYMSSVNIAQKNSTSPSNYASAILSKELTEKLCALTGQPYITLISIGSGGFKVTGKYSYFNVETSSVLAMKNTSSHTLSAKKIYYLGSSVTKGYDATGYNGNNGGKSFADWTALVTGGSFKKEAVSGTTLAVRDGVTTSYVDRITKLDLAKNKPDVLVVQLSTNDFTKSIAVGSVTNTTASSSFNKKTITGAIEYIIAYTKEKSPNTKVVFYSCPLTTSYAKYNQYKDYTNNTLRKIENKWKDTVTVLDIFNADYISIPIYMQGDGLHPMKEGYAQVFVPKFINLLVDMFK